MWYQSTLCEQYNNEENLKEKDEDEIYHIQVERPAKMPKSWGEAERGLH